MTDGAEASPAGARASVALVILSGGGFTFETKRLLGQVQDEFAFVFLRTQFGGIPGEGGLPAGASHAVPSFATKTQGSLLASVRAFVATFRITRSVLRQTPVDVVVAVGCSHSVPMFLAAKLAGVPAAFVESITRVQALSMTGQIVYRLRLARLFVVQWPELRSHYPASRLGTIL